MGERIPKSGIFLFFHIFWQNYKKIMIVTCSLRSQFLIQIFVQKMADFTILGSKKNEQMGKKSGIFFLAW